MVKVQCGLSLKRKHSWGRCSKTLYCFHKTCRNIRIGGIENLSEEEAETSPVTFSSINSSHISSLGKATGNPMWYHCTAPFSRDWKGWGDPENIKYYSHLKNRSERKSRFIILFWILEISWNVSSWSTFLHAQGQFYLGTVFTDVAGVDFAWAALLWQSGWIVDEGETMNVV